jgi:hypothetical protein
LCRQAEEGGGKYLGPQRTGRLIYQVFIRVCFHLLVVVCAPCRRIKSVNLFWEGIKSVRFVQFWLVRDGVKYSQQYIFCTSRKRGMGIPYSRASTTANQFGGFRNIV